MSAQRLTSTTALPEAEWPILEPLLPPEKTGGRPRTYPMREVINGIPYVLRAGCAWRSMPHDLRHRQTASQVFRAWRQDATRIRMPDQLRDAGRTRMGRHPHPRPR
jgi:putative transposase